MASSVKTKAASGSHNPAARQEKKKLWFGIIALGLLLLTAVGVVCGIVVLESKLFRQNERFVLRRVAINSPGGYYSKPAAQKVLIRALKLKVNQDNLFALDLANLRETIKKQPVVEDVRLRTVLPDTLKIDIEERLPRAFLGRPGSQLLTDANGMVLSRGSCAEVRKNLPVINGTPHINPKPGEIHPKLRPALDLIMEIQRFKCFSVSLINLNQAEKLVAVIEYHPGRSAGNSYWVTMPDRNFPETLNKLQSTLEDIRRRGENIKKIDLTLEGQAVLQR